jgi:hypothetical protein|nr:MAG TPA: hypothetical protein [Caudoviricetes sp.]
MAVTQEMLKKLLTCVRESERTLVCKEFKSYAHGWTGIILAWSMSDYPIECQHFRRLCSSNFFERRNSDEDFCEILARAMPLEPNFTSINTLAKSGAGLNDDRVRTVLGLLKLQAFPSRTHLKRFMEKEHEKQLADARTLLHDARVPTAHHQDGGSAD